MEPEDYTMNTDELEWAKSLIKPDLPDYDEKDHEIAKLRFVMNEMFEEFCEVYFQTSEWAQENQGMSWLEKMSRRLYNMWWKITGKRRRFLLVREPLRTMEDVHEKLGRILYDVDGNNNAPDGTDQSDIDTYASMRGWNTIKTII